MYQQDRSDLCALADDDDPLVDRAKRSGYGVTYAWFAMGFARFERVPDPEGDLVILHDLRFGAISDPTRTFMGAELLYNHDGRLIAAERRPPPTDLDVGRELEALWSHLAGEGPAPLDLE